MHIKFFLVDQEGNEEDLFLSYPSKVTTYDMMKANQYSEDILNGISSNINLCKKEFGKTIFTKDIYMALKHLQKKNKKISWYTGTPILDFVKEDPLKNRIGQFPILKYILDIQRISGCSTLLKMNLYDVSDFVFDKAFNMNMKAILSQDWEKVIVRLYPDLFDMKKG